MADRFYFPGDWDNDIVLEGNEAHHLGTVLRKQPGETIELFDGRGTSVEAEIQSVSKRSVQIRLTSELDHTPENRFRLTLAVAPPKRDRLQWLIEKATELGVDRFIPLQTERGVVKPGANKLDKLAATVIEACKQSRRNRLMEIFPSTSLTEVISIASAESSHLCFGHVPASRTAGSTQLPDLQQNPSVTVCIGPEGGWTETEVQQLLEAEAQPISISRQVLRIETAAIAITAALISQIDAQVE